MFRVVNGKWNWSLALRKQFINFLIIKHLALCTVFYHILLKMIWKRFGTDRVTYKIHVYIDTHKHTWHHFNYYGFTVLCTPYIVRTPYCMLVLHCLFVFIIFISMFSSVNGNFTLYCYYYYYFGVNKCLSANKCYDKVIFRVFGWNSIEFWFCVFFVDG